MFDLGRKKIENKILQKLNCDRILKNSPSLPTLLYPKVWSK